MRQYPAYIFDLYGTLVDIHTDERRPAFWRQIAAQLSAQGAAYTPQALREAYLRACVAETTRLAQTGGCPEEEIEIDLAPVFSALYSAKGIAADEALIAETAWRFRQASTCHLRAYAGAAELLQALRAQGRRVLLLSNAQALFTWPELRQLGLADGFDAVYISSSCGFRKPARQFMERLLEEQRLSPEDCRMIGNDPNSDMAVANTVGMDSFYLRSATSPDIAPEHAAATYAQRHINLRRLKSILLHNE